MTELEIVHEAIKAEREKLYIKARKLAGRFWVAHHESRQNNPKVPALYMVTVLRRDVGIEIRWTRRQFVKTWQGWKPKDVTLRLNQTKLTLPEPDKKKMLDWERELAEELEQTFAPIRKRSKHLSNLARSARLYDHQARLHGLDGTLRDEEDEADEILDDEDF